jgi:hypothetical protein
MKIIRSNHLYYVILFFSIIALYCIFSNTHTDKIPINDIYQILSQNEMGNITGGCGPCSNCACDLLEDFCMEGFTCDGECNFCPASGGYYAKCTKYNVVYDDFCTVDDGEFVVIACKSSSYESCSGPLVFEIVEFGPSCD